MRRAAKEKTNGPSPWVSRIAFWSISVIHDNPALYKVRNPHKTLKASGLGPGQRVLEVGCGPGFYTLAASDIVGESGRVYAVDVNPWAIDCIERKMSRSGAKNIRPLCTNASHTGLPAESIDLAFLFGVPRIAGEEAALLTELNRLLKPGAFLVCGKSRGSGKDRIERWERAGFTPETAEGDIPFRLKKTRKAVH